MATQIDAARLLMYRAAWMKDAGKKVSGINIYEDAGHGFMRPGSNPAYQEKDAKDAWQKIDQFFARTLGDR